MRGKVFIAVSGTLGVVLGAAILSQASSAHRENQQQQQQGEGQREPVTQPPPYNPYPPGILPPDLNSEIDSVRRELRFIYTQALADWRALPPPNPTAQPPPLQASGYDMVQTLGKLMNFDERISVLQNQAWASCHMPYAGISGPITSVNLTMIAYPGPFHFPAGIRTSQRCTCGLCFPFAR